MKFQQAAESVTKQQYYEQSVLLSEATATALGALELAIKYLKDLKDHQAVVDKLEEYSYTARVKSQDAMKKTAEEYPITPEQVQAVCEFTNLPWNAEGRTQLKTAEQQQLLDKMLNAGTKDRMLVGQEVNIAMDAWEPVDCCAFYYKLLGTRNLDAIKAITPVNPRILKYIMEAQKVRRKGA